MAHPIGPAEAVIILPAVNALTFIAWPSLILLFMIKDLVSRQLFLAFGGKDHKRSLPKVDYNPYYLVPNMSTPEKQAPREKHKPLPFMEDELAIYALSRSIGKHELEYIRKHIQGITTKLIQQLGRMADEKHGFLTELQFEEYRLDILATVIHHPKHSHLLLAYGYEAVATSYAQAVAYHFARPTKASFSGIL